jgi:hypothetical protein
MKPRFLPVAVVLIHLLYAVQGQETSIGDVSSKERRTSVEYSSSWHQENKLQEDLPNPKSLRFKKFSVRVFCMFCLRFHLPF